MGQSRVKNEAVRKLLALSGLTELRWRTLNPDLYCFNYHRIGEAQETAFDPGTFSCTQERFREQVALIRERFEIIGLERVSRLLDSRERLRRPSALITLDDGYIDNYSLALPVLREFDATAAFFVPTAFVGSNKLPWWDEISWLLRHARVSEILLAGSEASFSLRPEVLHRTIRLVLRLVKSRINMPMKEQVEEIRTACRTEGQVGDGEGPQFVNWSHLREMLQIGMEIGSHTHSHNILSHLNVDRQREELALSKEILEAELHAEVRSIAYPVGMEGSFTVETCEIAHSLGYRLGFSQLGLVNRTPIQAPLEINRKPIHSNAGKALLKSYTCYPWL
jgi:peptidoglycan/xylan/chitin deacetylase (PgdA/CDA1 family)